MDPDLGDMGAEGDEFPDAGGSVSEGVHFGVEGGGLRGELGVDGKRDNSQVVPDYRVAS